MNEPMKDPIFLANRLVEALQAQGYDTRSKNLENEWIDGGNYHGVDINIHRNKEIHIHPENYSTEPIKGECDFKCEIGQGSRLSRE